MRHLHSVIALAALAASAASADVTIYDNEADFLAAAPPVVTETFDDVPDTQSPLTIQIDELGFVTQGTWQLPGTCSLARTLGASSISRRHIIFREADNVRGQVTAIGFSITTFAIAPPADYGVAIHTADGAMLLEPVDDVVNATPAYRGFVSTSPIQAVSIQAVGLTQFNFCLDDVSHSTVDPLDEAGDNTYDPFAYE
jgi:hypothetical protein